jgi:hypothetical protein
MLSKNPFNGRQRSEYPDEEKIKIFWMLLPILFGFSNVDFAEKQINTFRCRYLIVIFYLEGFHTDVEVEFPRTPVNVDTLFSDSYHEASRRAAAEQKGSTLRSDIIFMLKYPPIPKHEIGIQ